MRNMTTHFIDDMHVDTYPRSNVDLLVFRMAEAPSRALDIDDFIGTTKEVQPRWAIPPWDTRSANWTSRAAERAKSVLGKCGVVVCGTSDSERESFFLWAQAQRFAPIILLPHMRKDRSRQIAELASMGYIRTNSYIHLPDSSLLTYFVEESFPGTYTTGDSF